MRFRARCVRRKGWAGGGVRFRHAQCWKRLRIGIVGTVTDYVNIWERPEYSKPSIVSDLQAVAALLSPKARSIWDRQSITRSSAHLASAADRCPRDA